jgi:hypothetical protein
MRIVLPALFIAYGNSTKSHYENTRVTLRFRDQGILGKSLALILLAAHAHAQGVNPVAPAGTPQQQIEIIERGQDFAVHRTVTQITGADGSTSFQTNQFTLLENGLHYMEDGQWKESQDVIESFPDGAVARKGPHKAIFSPDLNAEAVFDISTSDGLRLRGGVRQLQITDVASGASLVLGKVRASVKAQLLPPNRLLYRDAFDGIEADVLLEWRHNHYSHNVILRERPALPAQFAPASTRIEAVTEFVEAPEPEINEQVLKVDGQPDISDHVTLGFGSLFAPRGRAFAVAGDRALNLTGAAFSDEGTPVVKQWHKLDDGRRFLLESVGWMEAQMVLRDLPARGGVDAASPARNRSVADSRAWPKALKTAQKHEPVQVASAPYHPTGLLLDYDLSGTQTSWTFLTGTTYYIASSFSVGTGAATFQPGCVVKYGASAYLVLSGTITFPTTGTLMPVFTQKDDDLFGDKISGSTGTPSIANGASSAIWVFYLTSGTTISDARIRYATRGIRYDATSGVSANHSVTDSIFQECATGIYENLASGTLYLSNVKKCNVTTEVNLVTGSRSGTMTVDCGPYVVASQACLNAINMGNAFDAFDTMGGMGPNHFIQIGNFGIKIYRRDGTTESNWSTDLDTFFSIDGSGQKMLGGGVDPRVVYDPVSATWFATAMERNGTDGTVGGNNNVILAVSIGTNPVQQSGTNWIDGSWNKYRIPLAQAGKFLDFPTLGVDANGVYISAEYYANSVYQNQQIAAIRKDTLLTGTLNCTIFNATTTVSSQSSYGAIQPVVNIDSGSSTSPAWFLRTAYGNQRGVEYRPLTWDSFHVPTFASTWQTLANNTNDGSPGTAHSYPGTSDYDFALGGVGDRLSTSICRDGKIWTCHGIAKVISGADYRNGCEWLKLNINTGTSPQTLQLEASSLVYDSSSATMGVAMSYYFPSIAANSRGDVIMGFSGSSASTKISSYYTARPSGGSMSSPILLHEGDYSFYKWANYPTNNIPNGFGDYSATFFDPKNPGVFGTFQTYATYGGSGNTTNHFWGTWLNAISP